MVHKLRNININAKCIEENNTKEERILSQNLDGNFVLIKLDAESYKTILSLDKLIDSFDYFRIKSNFKHFYRNKNVVTLTNISRASFKTSLNLAIDGELKNIISIGLPLNLETWKNLNFTV